YFVRRGDSAVNADTSEYTISFSIATATQNTPPVISGGWPVGTLASSKTTPTMRVVTSENATCKYATSAGISYSAMPFSFTNTGGTSHAVLLTSTAGSTHHYYVRCADSLGMANTSDYPISFSIASSTAAPTALTVTATPNSGSGSGQTFIFQLS